MQVMIMRNGWNWIGWGIVVGLTSFPAMGAEPDPEEVRRRMEIYTRDLEAEEATKKAPASKPRPKPEPVSKPAPKSRSKPETAPKPVPKDVKVDKSVGYELYFDGKLVSGPDAAHYTRQQARENCDWNMQSKPHLHIRCVYNGKVLGDREAVKAGENVGYELYFDGKLVSGPDPGPEKRYTRQQARENCDWNMRDKPHLHIRCIYNGEVLGDRPAM